MLTGMTEGRAADVVPLAKSWLEPATVNAGKDAGAKYDGYDLTQYAHRFAMNPAKPAAKLSFTVAPAAEEPAIRPVFVVTGWGEREAKVTVGGKALTAGTEVRTGLVHTVDGTNLIIALGINLEKRATVTIAG